MATLSKVGVNGRVLSQNDSWGHDFILENPLLRHDNLAIALTFAEIEIVTMKTLGNVLKVKDMW